MAGFDIGPFQRIVGVSWNAYDSVAIEYRWTASSGRDLDTYTSLRVNGTEIAATGYGYGYGFSPVMTYDSGDVTSQGGTERVTINTKELKKWLAANYAPESVTSVKVWCGAHWFGEPQDGKVYFVVTNDTPAPGMFWQTTIVNRYRDPQIIGTVVFSNTGSYRRTDIGTPV